MAGFRWGTAAVAALVLGASVVAQDGKVAFEAVSIRPSVRGTVRSERVLPTRIDFVNQPLGRVLFRAFQLTDLSEAVMPAWLMDTSFDIQATYPEGITRAQVPEMLQTLLKERFGLVTHTEPRRIDGYELVVGKDGIKMQEVEPVNDLAKDFTKSGPRVSNESVSESFDGTVRQMALPEEIGFRTVTARSFYELRTAANGIQRIDAIRISMPEFALLLKLNVGRPVFDKTGLAGVYQFKTELDRLTSPLLATIAGNRVSSEPTGVSTFRAVEALGLKLRELRTPVDVLIVDNINRMPTEN